MSSSLLEMVLAIALSGLILGSAIMPTISVMSDYERLQLDLRTTTAHALAAVRAEQIAGAIWRDPEPPAGLAPLGSAATNRLVVGDWTFTANSGRIEQACGNGPGAALTEAAAAFAGQYLRNDGTWTVNVPPGQLAGVVALRLGWREPDSNTPFSAVVVPLDTAFGAATLSLAAPQSSEPYNRAACERTVAFTIGSW